MSKVLQQQRRNSEFEVLIDRVQQCRLCSRMRGCVRVLSWANGLPTAPLMFVGEAPGRLGADRTSIPFHGDKAGDNFERLLELAGLSRSQIFVTNAVLCNPRDGNGNNATPNADEIEKCSDNLRSQIDLVQPVMVMTLGAIALEATRRIENHDLTLKNSTRTANRWFGRWLLPLYHPGARALIHRSFANQTSDYYFVAETFRRLRRGSRKRSSAVRGKDDDWALVKYLLKSASSVSNFRLHKLLYLTEVRALNALGKRATDFLYLRQKDGPYCVELGSTWYRRFPQNLEIRKSNGNLIFEWRRATLFEAREGSLINSELAAIADEVIASSAGVPDATLKTRAYLTSPMKHILRAEKEGRKMLNVPILPGMDAQPLI